MDLPELLEQQAMALPPEERKKLGVKLLASVVVVEQPPRERRPGTAAGRVHMAPDFDAPLELVECTTGRPR